MQTLDVVRRSLSSQMFGWIAIAAILTASAASAEPPEKVSGLWAGSIALNGLDRPLVLQLEERADGRLLGYVLGHSAEEVVVSGSVLHKNVSLALEITTRSGAGTTTRQVTLAGRLKGRGQIDADLTVGSVVQTVKFKHVPGNIKERRFLVAMPVGENFIVNDLVALTTDEGGFVSGAFLGWDTCELWACEGRVDSFAETSGGATVDFTYHTSDACSAGSSAHLEFDAGEGIWSGTYTLRTCGPSTTGVLLGARTPSTQSSDVAQFLSRLANLADRMENPSPFGAAHDSFSPSYLDWGMNLAALLGRYNQEKTKYSSIEASFGRFTEITTLVEPGTWPDRVRPFGALFLETRRGVPAGGSSMETYVDSENRPDRPLLRHWTKEGTQWVIRGNDSAALDFPFEYSIASDGLVVPVNGGTDNVYVSLGSFGTHFPPRTGHAYGDLKANLVGYFTAGDAGLTPISGNRFAYDGGAGGVRLLERRPTYRAPLDVVLTRIECVGIIEPNLNNLPNWSVHLRFANGAKLVLAHVGEFHPHLRTVVEHASGLDPGAVRCVHGAPVANIFGEEVAIPFGRNEPLAWPQVAAVPVSGMPGFYTGIGTSFDRPWAQMEFFFSAPELSNRYWQDSRGACYYNYMDPAVLPILQEAMLVDLTHSSSQRFRSYQGPGWSWRLKAEAHLCMAPSDEPRDFRDLYTNLGGWYEYLPTGGVDEIVSFAPIAKDVRVYDPSDYYSPATTMLIARRKRNDGPPFIWSAPGLAPVSVYAPDGEIVERTADSLLIRWRNLPTGTLGLTVDYWQGTRYSLGAAGLKVLWGVFRSTRDLVAYPPASALSVPCNGTSIVCYNHDAYYAPGF